MVALSLQLSRNNSIGKALLACVLHSRCLLRSLFGSLYVSGKLPTYPSPKPTSTLTSHLGQNVGLGEGWVETYNDPPVPGSQILGKTQKRKDTRKLGGAGVFIFFHVLSQFSRPDYLGARNRLGLLQPRPQVAFSWLWRWALSQPIGLPRVLGIPIPKSLAFWASPSHITAAFWASPGTLPGCPNP